MTNNNNNKKRVKNNNKKCGSSYYYTINKHNDEQLDQHKLNGKPLTLSSMHEEGTGTTPSLNIVFIQNTNITTQGFKYSAMLCAYQDNVRHCWRLGFLLKQSIYSSWIAEACFKVENDKVNVSHKS